MTAEIRTRTPGPEVEVIDGKVFSVRHTHGQLLAAVAHSEFEVEAQSRFMKNHHPLSKSVDPYVHYFGSTAFVVIGEGLEYFSAENPFRTKSPKAETIYGVTGIFENCIFMGQYVGVKSRSSWHGHGPGEHFFNTDGNAFKFEDWGKKVSKLGTHTYVPPNELHMIYTLGKPAVNLILHEGTNLEHNPVADRPRPTIEELRELTVRDGLITA